MASRQGYTNQRKIFVIQKTAAMIEKEFQLKFLKESFPGVNPMTLHDALCEVDFDADKAAKLLIRMSKTGSKILSYGEWKKEVDSITSNSNKTDIINKNVDSNVRVYSNKRLHNNKSEDSNKNEECNKNEGSNQIEDSNKSDEGPTSKVVTNKRSPPVSPTNAVKKAKVEKVLKENKKKTSSDEQTESPVPHSSRTSQMTLDLVPQPAIRNEKSDSLDSKIGFNIEECSSSETIISRSESLVNSEEAPKQLRSSKPVEFYVVDLTQRRRSGLNENSIRVPKTKETSYSDYSFDVAISPNRSSFGKQTILSCMDYDLYDGNDMENDRKVLLNIFQTADANDLNFVTSFSKRAVDAIIECRPYKNWIDLLQKLQDNKHLDIDMLNTTRQLLDIYKNLKSLISKLNGISKTIKQGIVLGKIHNQPKLVSPSVRLMEHQILGLNWLVSMKTQKINGILIDEDQFSTSVQVISFLAYLKEVGETKPGIPHLVVIPSFKKDDWRSDFRRISPELNVFYYQGTKDERRQYRNEWYRGDLTKYDVIVTIQGTFLSTPEEIKMFRILQLHYVIFDETVAIKNITNINNEHVLKIKASQKLLLMSSPPECNILQMLSLLKFVFLTDFNISSDDLMPFINNKHLVQKSNLSNFHLKIVEEAEKALKNVSFHRLKKESLFSASYFKNETNINDQIESIIKEIQRLDLPIKKTFSQLTTSPKVFLKKKNLFEEMSRIKENCRKEESKPATRGAGSRRRGRGRFGVWRRARSQRYSPNESSTDYSSTEWNCGSSSEYSTESTDETFNNPNGETTKPVHNVAKRGRKWSGGTSRISHIYTEGNKSDTETSPKKKKGRRGRPRKIIQDSAANFPKLTTNHINNQTKKILEVQPTTRSKNANDEVDSDSGESNSTNIDTEETWNISDNEEKRNSKKNKKDTETDLEPITDSHRLRYMLRNTLDDIWSNKRNRSENEFIQNSDDIIPDEVKIEYDDITIKEEPLEKEVKVEVVEQFIKSSPGKQQVPPDPQEDPLFIREEDQAEVTSDNDVIFHIVENHKQNTISSTPKNTLTLTDQCNKKSKKSVESSDCIDLTCDDNDCIVVSDDSEIEEQLNKKISFNEVFADIDEHGSAKYNSKSRKAEKSATSKDAKSREPQNGEASKCENEEEFNLEITSDTEIVEESSKNTDALKRDDIMKIIFGNSLPKSSETSSALTSAQDNSKAIKEISLQENVLETINLVEKGSSQVQNKNRLSSDLTSAQDNSSKAIKEISLQENVLETINLVEKGSSQVQNKNKLSSALTSAQDNSSKAIKEVSLQENVLETINLVEKGSSQVQNKNKLSSTVHKPIEGNDLGKLPEVVAATKQSSSEVNTEAAKELSVVNKDNKLVNDSNNPHPEEEKVTSSDTVSSEGVEELSSREKDSNLLKDLVNSEDSNVEIVLLLDESDFSRKTYSSSRTNRLPSKKPTINTSTTGSLSRGTDSLLYKKSGTSLLKTSTTKNNESPGPSTIEKSNSVNILSDVQLAGTSSKNKMSDSELLWILEL